MEFEQHLTSFNFEKEVRRHLRGTYTSFVDDIAQEARIKAFKWSETVWDGKNPYNYFRKICFTLTVDFLRKPFLREVALSMDPDWLGEDGDDYLGGNPIFEDGVKRVASCTPELSYNIIESIIQLEEAIKEDDRIPTFIACHNNYHEYMRLGGPKNFEAYKELQTKVAEIAR